MIDIYGRKAKVLRPKEIIVEGKSVDGAFEYETYNIEIQKDLQGDKALITAIHESGHGLCHRLNLDLPHAIEEVIVEAFANHFSDNFEYYAKLRGRKPRRKP